MAKQTDASVPSQINMIGEGTVLDGTLRAESDLRVSGRIVGELDVEGKVIVAQEGTIEGEIKAPNADIAGTVKGDLYIEERLVLKGSARVEGNIQTERLVVEEGAHFDGKCQMAQRGSAKKNTKKWESTPAPLVEDSNTAEA